MILHFFLTCLKHILDLNLNVTSVYSHLTPKNIDCIERVQRYFRHYIPGILVVTYPERLDVLKLESFEARHLRNNYIVLFEIKIGLVHLNVNGFFYYRSRVPTECRPTLSKLNNFYSKSSYIFT